MSSSWSSRRASKSSLLSCGFQKLVLFKTLLLLVTVTLQENKNFRFGADGARKCLTSLCPTMTWQHSESTKLGERLGNHTSVKKHNTSSSGPIPGKVTPQHYIFSFITRSFKYQEPHLNRVVHFNYFQIEKHHIWAQTSLQSITAACAVFLTATLISWFLYHTWCIVNRLAF